MSPVLFNYRLLPAFLTLFGLVACRSGAQVTKTGETYQFRAKYSPGTKTTYAMKFNAQPMGGAIVQAPPGMLSASGPIVVNVESVKDTHATLKVTGGPMGSNGKIGLKEQTETIEVDAQNKLTTTSGSAARLDISAPVYPADPIALNDRFTTTQKLARSGRTLELVTTYWFRGLKTMGGQQVAELEATISGKGDTPYVSRGTIYVLVADGTLFGSDMRQNMRLGNAQRSVVLETQTTITRK